MGKLAVIKMTRWSRVSSWWWDRSTSCASWYDALKGHSIGSAKFHVVKFLQRMYILNWVKKKQGCTTECRPVFFKTAKGMKRNCPDWRRCDGSIPEQTLDQKGKSHCWDSWKNLNRVVVLYWSWFVCFGELLHRSMFHPLENVHW